MHSNCVFWAPAGHVGLPAARRRARLQRAAQRRAAPSSFRQQLSCCGAVEETCSQLNRGRLLCCGGKTTLWFHALSGEVKKKRERERRNPSEDFTQSKQNKIVFFSDSSRCFICSAKLIKCSLCQRLVAARFPSAQLSRKGRVQTIRGKLNGS